MYLEENLYGDLNPAVPHISKLKLLELIRRPTWMPLATDWLENTTDLRVVKFRRVKHTNDRENIVKTNRTSCNAICT